MSSMYSGRPAADITMIKLGIDFDLLILYPYFHLDYKGYLKLINSQIVKIKIVYIFNSFWPKIKTTLKCWLSQWLWTNN